ncbi:MAG: hypothetical protein J5849_01950, partial [Clostridia bacterium]|nr:hypothetical protein [Clostridia bacterium]
TGINYHQELYQIEREKARENKRKSPSERRKNPLRRRRKTAGSKKAVPDDPGRLFDIRERKITG